MPVWVATLRGHQNDVTSLAWASDGARLATGSKDGTARLWTLKGPVGSGRAVADDGIVKSEKWAPVTLGRQPGEQEAVPMLCGVTWTCDDAMLLTASSNGALGVWCGYTGTAIHALGPPSDGPRRGLPSPPVHTHAAHNVAAAAAAAGAVVALGSCCAAAPRRPVCGPGRRGSRRRRRNWP